MKLTALAPGKVNLCLFLGGTRADGRHELVTVFESVSLADELVLTTLPGGPDEVICPAIEGPNLVNEALAGLRVRGWAAPGVRIEIDKRIPIAGGMGGGSADAAATLRMARLVAPVSEETLAELAAELGADVPSQLVPGLALGRGAGERVQRRASLAPHALAVVPLPFRLSTAAVYDEADRLKLPRDQDEIDARAHELDAALQPGARVPERLLTNDLERAAVSLRPEVAEVLSAVRDTDAEDALVSGSGPTVVGLYWGSDASERAGAAAASLAERFPGAARADPAPPELGTAQWA